MPATLDDSRSPDTRSTERGAEVARGWRVIGQRLATPWSHPRKIPHYIHMQRTYESADGVRWVVEVTMPGASNAMVVFHHPGGRTARRDRYNWYNARVPEARSVTARLDPATVLQSITDAELAILFRRSMLISAADNPLSIPVTQSGS